MASHQLRNDIRESLVLHYRREFSCFSFPGVLINNATSPLLSSSPLARQSHQTFCPGPRSCKLVVLTLLVLLLSGDQKEDTMVNVQDVQDQRRPSSAEKQQQKSFDMFFSSKRKVPNASDPLHNR
ncbi:hypothetical protein OIU76_006315 [Salix suchowensis]|nr:hypothetical protein OIU76_006315 [Salix suchowensis]